MYRNLSTLPEKSFRNTMIEKNTDIKALINAAAEASLKSYLRSRAEQALVQWYYNGIVPGIFQNR